MSDCSYLDPVRSDLARVESLLGTHPPEEHKAISSAIDHLIAGGGKRLRPALVLLSARICGAALDEAVLAAAAAEMLHTATLVHDDLIDGSLIRRGVETLNASWTPAATILTGDYVFARAANLVTRTGNLRLTQRFTETLMVICNGEIRQVFNGMPDKDTVDAYRARIYAKTASLIALSAQAGAILASSEEHEEEALRTYGEQVGMAFQILDDVLDLVADEATLGKPVGSDLRQGLATLPVLLYLKLNSSATAVHQVLDGDRSDGRVREAVQAVVASPAMGEAKAMALEYAETAKAALRGFSDSPYRRALLDLADFAVDRRF